MISNATQRTIFRWVHIILAIPIIGYIYSPFEQIPDYAPAVRYVFFPVLVFAGPTSASQSTRRRMDAALSDFEVRLARRSSD